MSKAVALPWTITEKARNIHHLATELTGVRDERWFLLQSDVHWDNPHCDRDLLCHADGVCRRAVRFDLALGTGEIRTGAEGEDT